MPFITEELWHSLEERKENESISVSDFLSWMRLKFDEDIEKEVIIMQELVRNQKSAFGA